MALYVLVFLGTTPIGSLIIGWCAQRFGPRSGLWTGGLVSLIAALALGILQLRRVGGRIHVGLRPRLHVRVHETAGVPAVRPAVR
jgi:hypothetical protein